MFEIDGVEQRNMTAVGILFRGAEGTTAVRQSSSRVDHPLTFWFLLFCPKQYSLFIFYVSVVFLPLLPPLVPLWRPTQALGWHSWRVLAARAASTSPLALTAAAVTPHPPKTTLSEGRALLNAVVSPGSSSSGGGNPAAVLEGAALATAAASTEFVALQTAVTTKEAAVAIGWKRRRDTRVAAAGGGAGVTRGWERAFPAPPAKFWKEAAAAGDGQGQARWLVTEWETWEKSVSGLVEGMKGVLVGLAASAPSLRSSLEDHLETR